MPEANEFGQRIGDIVPGWTPRPYPTPVRLAGRYVVLEPLAPSHAPDLQAALGGTANRDLWTYRPTEPPDDVAGMEALVVEMLAVPGVETFAVRPGNGTAAGVTSLTRIDTTTGQVEVAGVLYARDLQRTPASTEVTHLLMRWAFDTLGYRRFEWKCDHFNEPSRRAALRLGFTYEGRFRAHMITKGRRRDTDWFSVVVEEWPVVRAAHERWLAPENFDDDGRQRSRLEVGPPRDGG